MPENDRSHAGFVHKGQNIYRLHYVTDTGKGIQVALERNGKPKTSLSGYCPHRGNR